MDRQITGTSDSELGASILKSATDAYRSVSGVPYESIVTMFEELEPQNVFETMLLSQMMVAHGHCVNLFEEAGKTSVHEMQMGKLKLAEKLMRTFASSLKILEQTRRKGSQNVTVEHVHVNQGAQAIVGNVGQGGY